MALCIYVVSQMGPQRCMSFNKSLYFMSRAKVPGDGSHQSETERGRNEEKMGEGGTKGINENRAV